MTMTSTTITPVRRQSLGLFTLLVLLAEALAEAKVVAHAALRRHPFVY
jgi:hypothetical protein